jgi:hypothetical protein
MVQNGYLFENAIIVNYNVLLTVTRQSRTGTLLKIRSILLEPTDVLVSVVLKYAGIKVVLLNF